MGKKIPVGNGTYLDEETGEFVGGEVNAPQWSRPAPTPSRFAPPIVLRYVNSNNGNNNSQARSYNSNQGTNSNASKVGIVSAIIVGIFLIGLILIGLISKCSSPTVPGTSSPTPTPTPKVTIPKTTTSIKPNEYADKQLPEIDIPDSVRSIGSGAFSKNNFTSIEIPNSVRTIGMNAFADNPIVSISIGANVTLDWSGDIGILGRNEGFNSAYDNNNSRAGTYTRANTYTTEWKYNGQVIQKPTATVTNPSIIIQNATGNTINGIFLGPILDGYSWGSNELDSLLLNGHDISLQLPYSLNYTNLYHICLFDTKGNRYSKWNVTVSNNSSIRFTTNDILQ